MPATAAWNDEFPVVRASMVSWQAAKAHKRELSGCLGTIKASQDQQGWRCCEMLLCYKRLHVQACAGKQELDASVT